MKSSVSLNLLLTQFIDATFNFSIPRVGGYLLHLLKFLSIISLINLGGLCWGSPIDRINPFLFFGASIPFNRLFSLWNG